MASIPPTPHTTAMKSANVNKIISPIIVCNCCNLVMLISYNDIKLYSTYLLGYVLLWCSYRVMPRKLDLTFFTSDKLAPDLLGDNSFSTSSFSYFTKKFILTCLGRMKKWGGGYLGQHNKTISVGVVWYGISIRRKSSSEPSSSSSPVLRKWNTVLTCRTSRQTKFLRTENFVLHKVLRLKRGGYPLQYRVTQSQYVDMSKEWYTYLEYHSASNLLLLTSLGEAKG